MCQPFSSYKRKAVYVFNKNQTIKACGGVEILLHALLSSALDRSELSPSRFGRLTQVSPYPFNRELLGPYSRSGPFRENKIFFILPGIEPRFLCRQFYIHVTIRFREVFESEYYCFYSCVEENSSLFWI
jgi:hypothetical protein